MRLSQRLRAALLVTTIATTGVLVAATPAAAPPRPPKPTTTTAPPVQPDAVTVSPALPGGTCVGEPGVPNGTITNISVAGPRFNNKLFVTSGGLLQYTVSGNCAVNYNGGTWNAPFSAVRTVSLSYTTTSSSITYSGLTLADPFLLSSSEAGCYDYPAGLGCVDYLDLTSAWTGSVTYTAHTSAELAALSTFQASAKTPADHNTLINALAN